jgi:hypothetical protein
LNHNHGQPALQGVRFAMKNRGLGIEWIAFPVRFSGALFWRFALRKCLAGPVDDDGDSRGSNQKPILIKGL